MLNTSKHTCRNETNSYYDKAAMFDLISDRTYTTDVVILYERLHSPTIELPQLNTLHIERGAAGGLTHLNETNCSTHRRATDRQLRMHRV